VWSRFERAPCYRGLAPNDQTWVQLFRAVGRHDAAAMAQYADALLAANQPLSLRSRQYLLTASLAGNILSGELDRAQSAWDRHSAKAAAAELDLRLLHAYLMMAKAKTQ
jgi:hypothetical protein